MKKLMQIWFCAIVILFQGTAYAKSSAVNNNLTLNNLSGSVPTVDWIRQVGTFPGYAVGTGISTDNFGNIYATGFTNLGLLNLTQHGVQDYFISKYDKTGNLIGIRQVGAISGNSNGWGISADNLGNVYVSGYTDSGLSGQKQNGTQDYFIAKYDASNNLVWSRQVGALGGKTYGRGISADNSGNIYVTGYTDVGISGQEQKGIYDYFIAKYDTNGNLVWSKQVGTKAVLQKDGA